MDLTLTEFKAALSSLTKEDETADGLPKMKPLNAALKAAGHSGIDATIRDTFLAEMAGETTEEITPGTVRLTLTESACDPLPLHIHGVGQFSLRIGTETELPEEALDALNHVGGITFELKED
jgi:hypothetical protein